jgi:hypothetical protein
MYVRVAGHWADGSWPGRHRRSYPVLFSPPACLVFLFPRSTVGKTEILEGHRNKQDQTWMNVSVPNAPSQVPISLASRLGLMGLQEASLGGLVWSGLAWFTGTNIAQRCWSPLHGHVESTHSSLPFTTEHHDWPPLHTSPFTCPSLRAYLHQVAGALCTAPISTAATTVRGPHTPANQTRRVPHIQRL